MTLVAAWMEQDVPLLIGDFLTTGTVPKPGVTLPTTDDLDAALKLPAEWQIPDGSMDWTITGMNQKLYKISDSLVLGCLGSGLTARIAVREATHCFQGTTPSLSDLKAFFTRQLEPLKPACTIIGWIVESGRTWAFRWKSSQPENVELDDTFIDGSGAPYLQEVFHADCRSAGFDPLKSALSKVTSLLAHEVRRGSNLTGKFGAGYQIFVGRDGRFVTPSSVTYLFLRGFDTGKKVIFGTEQRMLRTFRANEIEHTLVLVKDGNTPGQIDQRVFLTLPLGMSPSDARLPGRELLKLNSEFYCVDVEVQRSDSIAGNCTFVASDDEKESLLRIVTEPDGTQEIELHSWLLRQSNEVVRSWDTSKHPVRQRFYLD